MIKILQNIFFTLFLFFSQYLGAQMCFSVAVNYSVGTNPRGITYADFNNDGKIDLAFTQFTSNNVTTLLGNGLGSFGAASNFSVGNYPVSVTSADFNNDGKIDLATSNVSSTDVSVLLGNGAGSFGSASSFSVGLNPYTVISADFNKDGNVDLATANNNSSNVAILLGNGTGSFAAATYYTVGGYPYCLTAGDFNNDNKLDIATSNAASGNISVIFGNGLGIFGAATTYTGGLGAYSIISADLQSNGEVDLIISNFYTASVGVFKGNGAGVFAPMVNYSVGTNPNCVSSADYNGDGKPDVVSANYTSNNVSVLLGDGQGSFAVAVNFSVGLNPYSITSADFNGDNRIDLATTNEIGGNTSILLNNSPPVTANASANPICIGSAVTLTGSGANTYTWTNGITNGVAFTPSVTLKYFVTGTNTITNCSYTSAKTITVNTLPGVNVVSSNSLICSGQTATLTINGAAVSYSLNSIATSTIASVSPTVTTTYTIIGTDFNGCSNTASVTLNVSLCTGIENFSETPFFTISPNPNSGQFIITISQPASDNTIEIFNIVGDKIYSENILSNKLSVKLNEINKGIYFCHILSHNKTTLIQKVVIQ